MSTHIRQSAFYPNKGSINISLKYINGDSIDQRDKIVRYLHADALMKGVFEPDNDGDATCGFHMLHYIMNPNYYLYSISEANTGTMVGFVVLNSCIRETGSDEYAGFERIGPLVCEVFEVRFPPPLPIAVPRRPAPRMRAVVALCCPVAPSLHSHDNTL